MNFDLRLPIGILFSFYGVVLVLFGALGNKDIYQRSLGLNINLIWGAVLLLFGVMMLALVWRAARKDRSPNQVGG
jgi:multisubunit Na+/H+ antiporter MnhG subunit